MRTLAITLAVAMGALVVPISAYGHNVPQGAPEIMNADPWPGLAMGAAKLFAGGTWADIARRMGEARTGLAGHCSADPCRPQDGRMAVPSRSAYQD